MKFTLQPDSQLQSFHLKLAEVKYTVPLPCINAITLKSTIAGAHNNTNCESCN